MNHGRQPRKPTYPSIWHSLQPCGHPRRHSILPSNTSHTSPILRSSYGCLVGSLRPLVTILAALFPFEVLQPPTPRYTCMNQDRRSSPRRRRPEEDSKTKPWLFIARDLAPRLTVRLPFQAREASFGSCMILHFLSYLCHPGCLSWQNGHPLTTCPPALQGRTISDSVSG